MIASFNINFTSFSLEFLLLYIGVMIWINLNLQTSSIKLAHKQTAQTSAKKINPSAQVS